MSQVNSWIWTITSMQQLPSGSNAGYVVSANWTLTGSDGSQTASTQGYTQFPIIASKPGFIPYSQLTQSIVVGWIQELLGATGVAIYYSTVQDQINKLESPPIASVTQPLPWVTA